MVSQWIESCLPSWVYRYVGVSDWRLWRSSLYGTEKPSGTGLHTLPQQTNELILIYIFLPHIKVMLDKDINILLLNCYHSAIHIAGAQ